MATSPIDAYFASFESLKELRRAKDYDAAYRIARGVLPGLKELMRQDLETYGRRCIDSSPPLDYVLRHIIFLTSDDDAREQFDEIRAFLADPRTLAEWMPWVDDMVRTRSLWRAILDQLRTKPGCIQKDLKYLISSDGRTISWLLYEAEKRGLVRRIRSGKSYQVYPASFNVGF